MRKSSGDPNPYMHETVAITITSRRETSALAAEILSFSISSFIEESFSM